MPDLSALEQTLRRIAPGGYFALAFSGGLDSRFLAHAAHALGFHVRLFHISGPHIAGSETEHAASWAEKRGFPFTRIELDPLGIPLVSSGDKKRCYACKRMLFSRLLEISGRPLCDGSNASDGDSYRPGAQAARELGVLSPLAMAGLAKADIRNLAAQTGMDEPDQLPRPCLLTRLPYGMSPERRILHGLEQGEQAVRNLLFLAGFKNVDFRLRLVSPAKLELHFMQQHIMNIPDDVLSALSGAVATAAPGLPPASVVTVERLSGYYDRPEFQPAAQTCSSLPQGD